jgi:hypothetical protein
MLASSSASHDSQPRQRRSRPKTGEEAGSGDGVEGCCVRLFHRQSGSFQHDDCGPVIGRYARKRITKGVVVNFLDKLPGLALHA